MNRNRTIALLITAAIIALGWWILSGGAASVFGDASFNRSAGLSHTASSSANNHANAPALAPQNVLSIRPNAPKPSAAIETAIKGASAAAPYKESELARAYRMRESAQALLARIAQTPDDGEALRIKAKILEQCAKVKDDEWREALKDNKRFAEMETLRKTDPRGTFLKSLPKDAPENPTRTAAFDRLNLRFCEGLDTTEITKAELNSIYAASAKLGDVPSIAREFACEIASAAPKISLNASFSEQMNKEPVKIELSQAKQAQLQELLRAGHPESLDYVMWVMNQDYSNVKVRLPGQIGTRQDPQNYTTKRALQELIACDLGKPCAGTNNPDLDRRCAYQGQCNLQSIPDAIHFHELSPASSQSVELTRQALRDAIATGNFSAMKFEPVEPGAADSIYFSSMSSGEEIGCRR
jgi:hypothetical protein